MLYNHQNRPKKGKALPHHQGTQDTPQASHTGVTRALGTPALLQTHQQVCIFLQPFLLFLLHIPHTVCCQLLNVGHRQRGWGRRHRGSGQLKILRSMRRVFNPLSGRNPPSLPQVRSHREKCSSFITQLESLSAGKPSWALQQAMSCSLSTSAVVVIHGHMYPLPLSIPFTYVKIFNVHLSITMFLQDR